MLNFEGRTGPELQTPVAYPSPGVPQWWQDAKLGVFWHWGLYSIPAWASVEDPPEDTQWAAYAWHHYAEWYANTMRIEGSPTRERHQRIFGVGTSYEDLADLWRPDLDAVGLARDVRRWGARYFVPTTKHHDGFCLWDTATTGFNAARRGPGRDLIADLETAMRGEGLRFGLYFSGALDWHVSEFPAITSDEELFSFRRQDEAFARYAASQVDELIERFRPDVLWNDIEWPDAGKGHDEWGLGALFRRYLQAVPEGVLNDRWGVPFHGHLTREYARVDDIIASPWEATRGIGRSFGYNEAEGEGEYLSGAGLVRLLVDVVAKGGNLLLNIGPDASGGVPDRQRDRLDVLGGWLAGQGEAIYGTRPWVRYGDNGVRYTHRDGQVYVFIMDPWNEVQLPPELVGRKARWLGEPGEPWPLGERVRVPGVDGSGLVRVLEVGTG